MIVTNITRKALLRSFVSLIAIACVGQASAQAWTHESPTGTAPAARYEHTAVYGSASNSMIVFGGYIGGPAANDVWVLNHADGSGGTPAWTQLAPTGALPAARRRHAAVYASSSNSMIVFGGYTSSVGYANDVWVLSNADGSGGTPVWTQLAPTGTAPATREFHTAVYAASSNSMIVFGGFGSSGVTNDVWVLSNADGSGGTPAWTQLSPTGTAPAGRYEHTAVYASASNSMIVFGGETLSTCCMNDVWVLSHADGSGGTPAWTHLAPTGTAPAVRYASTAVYDSAGNSMIVFGGNASSGRTNDVWVLAHADGSDGTPAWTQLSPTGGPPAARYSHTAVYDAAANAMVVFGGCTNSACPANDVWALADADPNQPPNSVPVNIDIRPNTAVNTISLTNGTNIPVAILSSASFNALTQVDKTSLTFGHSGSEASLIGCDLRGSDVNADGYKDLVCHFNGTQGSFVMGDTIGYLQGKTTVSNTISGSDTVTIIK